MKGKRRYSWLISLSYYLYFLLLVLVIFVISIVLYLSRHFNRSKRIEEKLDEVLKKMASKKED